MECGFGSSARDEFHQHDDTPKTRKLSAGILPHPADRTVRARRARTCSTHVSRTWHPEPARPDGTFEIRFSAGLRSNGRVPHPNVNADEIPASRGPAAFATTHWRLVLRAGQRDAASWDNLPAGTHRIVVTGTFGALNADGVAFSPVVPQRAVPLLPVAAHRNPGGTQFDPDLAGG